MWSSPDADLVALGTRELAKLGLSKEAKVIDGTVVRQRAAYLVYDGDYRRAVDVIREFIEREMPNL
jgi:protoporphyrinogen oxidase